MDYSDHDVHDSGSSSSSSSDDDNNSINEQQKRFVERRKIYLKLKRPNTTTTTKPKKRVRRNVTTTSTKPTTTTTTTTATRKRTIQLPIPSSTSSSSSSTSSSSSLSESDDDEDTDDDNEDHEIKSNRKIEVSSTSSSSSSEEEDDYNIPKGRGRSSRPTQKQTQPRLQYPEQVVKFARAQKVVPFYIDEIYARRKLDVNKVKEIANKMDEYAVFNYRLKRVGSLKIHRHDAFTIPRYIRSTDDPTKFIRTNIRASNGVQIFVHKTHYIPAVISYVSTSGKNAMRDDAYISRMSQLDRFLSLMNVSTSRNSNSSSSSTTTTNNNNNTTITVKDIFCGPLSQWILDDFGKCPVRNTTSKVKHSLEDILPRACGYALMQKWLPKNLSNKPSLVNVFASLWKKQYKKENNHFPPTTFITSKKDAMKIVYEALVNTQIINNGFIICGSMIRPLLKTCKNKCPDVDNFKLAYPKAIFINEMDSLFSSEAIKAQVERELAMFMKTSIEDVHSRIVNGNYTSAFNGLANRSSKYPSSTLLGINETIQIMYDYLTINKTKREQLVKSRIHKPTDCTDDCCGVDSFINGTFPGSVSEVAALAYCHSQSKQHYGENICKKPIWKNLLKEMERKCTLKVQEVTIWNFAVKYALDKYGIRKPIVTGFFGTRYKPTPEEALLDGIEPNSSKQLIQNLNDIQNTSTSTSKQLAQAKLDVGTALSLSYSRQDNIQACKILDEVQHEAAFSSFLFESLFWMACSRLHMGEYREARILSERLLRRDPDSILAKTLLSIIRSKVRSDGLKGLVVVVLVASVAAVAGHIFGSMRRGR